MGRERKLEIWVKDENSERKKRESMKRRCYEGWWGVGIRGKKNHEMMVVGASMSGSGWWIMEK